MSNTRERFESWAVSKWAKNNSMHASIVLERGKDGEYCSLMTRGAWIGWQAACLEGWQAVPVEFTPEMKREVQVRSEMGTIITSECAGAYDMMNEYWRVSLSAAPQPGERE